jgi:tetratricopeptide (TPR) repeat protein
MIPRNLTRTILAVILITSFLVLFPRPSGACGPFFSNAIFVYTKHPDFPLERFAAGQIGVLQPSYARSYLVAAYRNLISEKLSDQEIAGLKSLWEDRLNNAGEVDDTEWIRKWNEARAKVPGTTAVQISTFRSRDKPHEYETYVNCQEDAFTNAETTLNERIKRFGVDSPNVREWLKAQDTVFSNCREGATMPEAAPADVDGLIRADRAYQIAAAHFYAAQFTEATKDFDAIARDSSSPWHDVAAYLAARSLLRKGSLADKDEEGKPSLSEAENRFLAIVDDKSLTRSHHAARRLLSLTRLRLRPEEKLHELSQAIAKRGAADEFKQTVWDYTLLLDKYVGDEVKVDAVPQAIRRDDLTDWILTFQDGSAASASHAIERWQSTQTLPWLVAAMASVNARDPKVNALLEAAGKVDHNSSAFPSLAFHAVRLLMETNRSDEARNSLDRILARDRKNLAPSALNLLLGQRMDLSQNLDEFLQTAQRVPAGTSDNNDGREIPDEPDKDAPAEAQHFFDWDAANVFNRLMPVATIGEAARSRTLAPNLHGDVVQTAFMRAALIDDRTTANQAATTLSSLYPELKEYLTAYQRATTPDARRFAAAYLSLKFPGLRPYVTVGVSRTSKLEEIDSFRDNWWCGDPPSTYVQDGGARTEPVTVPLFLKNSQSVAVREAAAIHALGTGPNYLAQTAINFGTKNPADTRIAEALHLAVKSTRYGCTDKETGRWSKAAFDLLHRRYPNTTWAKETKYWFKG